MISEDTKSKALVIGVGSIGLRHAQNLHAKKIEVSLYDIDQERVSTIATEKGYTQIKELTKEELQKQAAVFICTPTNHHLAPAKLALSSGCGVFIEKPIAVSTSQELEEINNIARNKKNVTLIGCNMRFHPAIQELSRIIASGELGKIYSAHVYFGQYLPFWRKVDYRKTYSAKVEEGGGMLLEGIHEFDYLVWLFGKVEDVSAIITKASDLEMDGEDVVEVILKFRNGVLAHIHIDCLQKTKRRGYEVIGELKTILWESIGSNPEKATTTIFETSDEPRKVTEKVIDPNYMYEQELDYFLSCIEKSLGTMNDIENSIYVLKIVEAARQSALTKKTVAIKD